jgi:formylglycine-generating enzyme required for sulfatase activity
MARQTVYTVGGTVQAGGGIYIKRKADDELLALCRRGEFVYILSSRQIGKSSLVVRTAEQLEQEDIQCVIVDLSAIGVNVSADEWYLGILNEISISLSLHTNIFTWWDDRRQLGPTQRLLNFFRDVLLNEVSNRVVIFFDEIDSTLSIPFSDDFYAALRSLYNARSTYPELERLSVVLIGVATPSDLIADNRRTPFNIGRRVELTDFTLEEAQPLSAGLGINGEVVLEWVFEWTRGHPYLTQLMCASLAKGGESLTKDAVRNTVELLFRGEQGRRDNNLQFVRDMLTKRAPDVRRVLTTYRNIRLGKSVADDERSAEKAHLKISGVVRRENGLLKLRNPIYENTFDTNWINESMPSQTNRNLAIIVLVLLFGVTVQFYTTGQLDQYIYRPLPMQWAVLPAGVFRMGSDKNPNESPVHVVYLDTYEIGVYEVTNSQYMQCVKAGTCSVPVSYDAEKFSPEVADLPVTDVSWVQADIFCRWADRNGRLPTEAEWEKAARGTDARIYPWGNDFNSYALNYCDKNCKGAQADLSNDDGFAEAAPVGSYSQGSTPNGIYDMSGNVWEWVADWYVAYPGGDPSSDGSFGEIFRVLRGGSWLNDADTVRTTFRFPGDPASTNGVYGFRCARSH